MPKEKNQQLVSAIYFHPEAYPPTLNAIEELSTCFESIELIYRPHLHGSWVYPKNVAAIASGRYMTAKDQEGSSLSQKISFFTRFRSDLLKRCLAKKPDWILLYDNMALLAYRSIRPFLRFKHKVWYHNHDVTQPELIRKYSLGWLASRVERQAFKYLELFTLPTDDRLPYFERKAFRGKYFCIPNYPSWKLYSQFHRPKTLRNELRLIFQGRLDRDHGLEEIIPLLGERINGHPLKLVLKGYLPEEYHHTLKKQAEEQGVWDHLEFHGYSPYIEVPKLAAGCHIGIGIFAKKDLMNQTLGTASNKVYEYAACNLPVLYLANSNFSRYLNEYSWAISVELSSASIRNGIERILENYEAKSNAAYQSFSEKLHFEYHFKEVKNYLIQPNS